MIADIDSFDATFCDIPEPGYHSIEKEGLDLIKIPILKVEDRILNCHFEVLKSNFTQEEIEELIYVVLLRKFCHDFYRDKADFVQFTNIKTHENWRNVYLG